MPVRQLPVNPDLAQLKQLAKELLRAQRSQALSALQRIREFHPRYHDAKDAVIAKAEFGLSDAQLTIARESGFASWPRLKAFVEDRNRENLRLPMQERIKDAAFRRAVDLLDAGDVPALRAYLTSHPNVVRQRMSFEGGNYFQHPTLLEFIAENPTRRGTLPPTAPEIARVILDAGAKDDRPALDSALDLVASSSVAHASALQDALIDVLCDYGADPNAAVFVPLLYSEFDAVRKLIARGARVDLVVAAGLNLTADARALLGTADELQRQKALALAAQHGYLEIARLLLDAGVDPNRYCQGHSHSTPLHQAAGMDHLEVTRLLVERGARTDLRDVHWNGTPLDWALHGKREAVAEYLRQVAANAPGREV